MIMMPWDKDYKVTKQIMLGNKAMKPEFKLMAEWIDKTYGVKTINVIYDTIDNGERPRLEIYFEYEHEKLVFTDKNSFNFDRKKQKAIAGKFKEALKEQGLIEKKEFLDFFKKSSKSKYNTSNIWITYAAFEPIAKIEANNSIPEDKLVELKKHIDNKGLWEISRAAWGITFFLHTDQQVKQYENSKAKNEWTNKYFKLLQEYDEFGYFKQKIFSINLDSKENFDNNYDSNWYYYYK